MITTGSRSYRREGGHRVKGQPAISSAAVELNENLILFLPIKHTQTQELYRIQGTFIAVLQKFRLLFFGV